MVTHDVMDNKWILALAAVVLLFNAIKGLSTGGAILFYRTMMRSEDGYLYWFAVWGSATAGIAALVMAFI